jgi:hypothetical protein
VIVLKDRIGFALEWIDQAIIARCNEEKKRPFPLSWERMGECSEELTRFSCDLLDGWDMAKDCIVRFVPGPLLTSVKLLEKSDGKMFSGELFGMRVCVKRIDQSSAMKELHTFAHVSAMVRFWSRLRKGMIEMQVLALGFCLHPLSRALASGMNSSAFTGKETMEIFS